VASEAAGVNAAALRLVTTGDRARLAAGVDAAAMSHGTAGDGASLAASVNAAAVRVGAAGENEARLAAGLNAAADGMTAAGDGRRAGVEIVEGGAADDTDGRRGDVATRRGRTAATSVDAAADRGAADGDPSAGTEILGQRALNELGKWIHDSSPLRKNVCEYARRTTWEERGVTAEREAALASPDLAGRREECWGTTVLATAS